MITLTNEIINSPDSELYKLISSPECDGNEFDELVTAAAEYAMNNGLTVAFKMNSELAAEKREVAKEWFCKSRDDVLNPELLDRLYAVDYEPEQVQRSG